MAEKRERELHFTAAHPPDQDKQLRPLTEMMCLDPTEALNAAPTGGC